jgi:hypothetical protein
MCARLIQSGMATLNELRTVYSLEDAYHLNEVLSVKLYNEWVSYKNNETKHG